jgi:DNA-binding MarR family transcriptional regulator
VTGTSGRALSASAGSRRGAHAPLRTWLRLLASSTLVEREVRRRLRVEFDITLPRFDVLAQLDAASRESVHGLTMSELSRRLMVTNGNLTGLIEALVGERLVSRAVSPTDRRTQIVRLTASGRRALHAMTPAHERWIDDMFGGLTPDECAQLHSLLGRLRGSIRDSLSPEVS